MPRLVTPQSDSSQSQDVGRTWIIVASVRGGPVESRTHGGGFGHEAVAAAAAAEMATLKRADIPAATRN